MLKIGEYTRINGKIGKVKDIVLNGNNYEDSGIYLENEKFILGKEEIYKLKSSKNIIDLIEEGDYVNGSEVLNFENKYIEEKDKFICYGVITENCYLENANSFIIEKKIKNILTKEQYENNCYKVEE